MYPLPDDGSPEPDKILSNIPSSDPIDVVVRVYVVKVGEYPLKQFSFAISLSFLCRALTYSLKTLMVNLTLT